MYSLGRTCNSEPLEIGAGKSPLPVEATEKAFPFKVFSKRIKNGKLEVRHVLPFLINTKYQQTSF